MQQAAQGTVSPLLLLYALTKGKKISFSIRGSVDIDFDYEDKDPED